MLQVDKVRAATVEYSRTAECCQDLCPEMVSAFYLQCERFHPGAPCLIGILARTASAVYQRYDAAHCSYVILGRFRRLLLPACGGFFICRQWLSWNAGNGEPEQNNCNSTTYRQHPGIISQ